MIAAAKKWIRETPRKVQPWDAVFYIAAQFIGGVVGVWLARLMLGRLVAHDTVNYAATLPGARLWKVSGGKCAELGRRIARKLNAATGPTALFVPLRGVSMIDVEGMPFHDPAADEALFAALRETLDPRVEAHWLDLDVNDESRWLGYDVVDEAGFSALMNCGYTPPEKASFSADYGESLDRSTHLLKDLESADRFRAASDARAGTAVSPWRDR